MSDYISREAVLLHLNDIWLSASPTDTMYDDDRQLAMVRCMGLNDAMDVVKDAPAADVRPVGLLEQVEWERDTAFAQLAEIGKSFGEKMDDVRPVVLCRDCKYWFNAPAADGFNSCERDALIRHEDFFCAAGEKREES